MAEWKSWLQMSSDSFYAGAFLMGEQDFARSAVSRFYYSAFQAATALLLSIGQVPPIVKGQQRETWDHETIPTMVVSNLKGLIPDETERYDMYSSLRFLYNARIYSDYSAGEYVDEGKLISIHRQSSLIRKKAEYILGDVNQ